MPISTRHLAVVLAIVLAACTLSGCGTINEKLAAGMGDVVPAWAGGLPADAPPRPGTAKYDEFMKERERKRLLPAAERGDTPAPTTAPSSQDAIH
jgi:predicted small secreted protein